MGDPQQRCPLQDPFDGESTKFSSETENLIESQPDQTSKDNSSPMPTPAAKDCLRTELLAEDHPESRNTSAGSLDSQQQDFEVNYASSSQEHSTVYLLDRIIPKTNGLQSTNYLRRSITIFGQRVRISAVAAYLALFAFLAITARNSRTLHEQGHDWGDDFSLYVHQAKAIFEGNTGEVIADTRFSVIQSGWPFSPNGYPWGWPLVLAPGVLLWGINYYKLKLIVTAMFLLALFFFFRFTARRTGHLGALALVGVLGTNYFYVGWTASVLSEFCFWASVLFTLLCFDRYRNTGAWLNESLRPGVVTGLALTWTMNVRREGLGLVLGLLVLCVVEGIARREEIKNLGRSHREHLRRLLTPFATFGLGLLAFQIALPTDFLPNAQKSGPENIRRNLEIGKKVIGEQLGIKDPGDVPFRWMHNSSWGNIAISLLIGLALAGLVLRFVMATRQDGWLVGAVIGHAYIVTSAPSSEGRYYYALTPWVAYFAFQSIPSFVTVFQKNQKTKSMLLASRLVATVGIGCLIASNLPEFNNALRYHKAYSYVENGPDTPDAIEMFQAVRTHTRPRDVILFFRARGLNLYTDRRTVQNSDLKRMSTIADWYVMAKGSTYSQTLVTPETAAANGLESIWENSTWVLWRFVASKSP
jgi:hypothetical protein